MGDVSMLAAEIVGPRGRVLGIDRDPAATDRSRRRARNEGFDASLNRLLAEVYRAPARRRTSAAG